ncbi:hypothetical protein C7H19_24580 [Aphanothece hegewaldii CCALA 016]|uniref:Uncharacterized protein n=1 Tax=Aphanothece hegewaldii CCALA 016 TaxID=2107694 RepID=A0A2T1LQL0_9CHRO|nr:hypothetical protein [Aphanothece hegewaldii]PSF28549.1 hypothetical protein C7H19_24580 [Aphanothece hegewaldii CCALA 016]
MKLEQYPDLDFAREVTTAYYRTLSSLFPMSDRPIHIDSSLVVEKGVEVTWAYYNWEIFNNDISYGMRFTIIIDNEFWLEQQAKLLSQLQVIA